ncbi:hypothetical protein EMIHUDRAFT_79419 [Emiliania huxleyi CCMP1516]|uniref:Uncharacterized protein n=2 Tax=Emiliania huxleyi TaxID=2903 RepID=A0A0D3KPT2_EMIH1|nr:hypothetical protein EMIHUDRAFT_79821 [Emiliania huxleyi CCMP1516]XP_005761007.1 hypothetical protein EMIHUDRAFT_79303 [Emiliania huxleyi CCMP1516]XP_005790196.1 hypothetical protein EMIHUDRAFT_79419 [Emiliania huxleyi CCMP1516]EOD04143.1 hypothetical protein EMIHUDRAFT_79821 [Emiliania huxleyi CCMP1516]EOD08578.1 hypothetical protein EMIHUDRAFT_79303 [Emiliania huxleyi CCMP1516]EOD37767.1 hypothetical protein EMIHUDRAFT_79419 [Emiliania huxleyi CCMP1516]|eukprot:XP_005756572.1 hypothetical protein EMIHUDRAFT_79821 [Emiliania huxleyi CCMP1516]
MTALRPCAAGGVLPLLSSTWSRNLAARSVQSRCAVSARATPLSRLGATAAACVGAPYPSPAAPAARGGYAETTTRGGSAATEMSRRHASGRAGCISRVTSADSSEGAAGIAACSTPSSLPSSCVRRETAASAE